jgi:glycosyltransferase involved in cell wall biosynthesis
MVSKLYPRRGKPLSGTFVHNQVRALRRAGADVCIMTPVARVPRTRQKASGEHGAGLAIDAAATDESAVYVHYLHVPLAISTRLEMRMLSRALQRAVDALPPGTSFDVVHAHQVFPTGFAAMRVARRLEVPLVVTAHGSDIHTNPHRSRAIMDFTRRVLDGSDLIVTVSQALAREVDSLAGSDRGSRVVYSGVDPGGFSDAPQRQAARSARGLPGAGVAVCTLCRLDAAKGVFELLEAFAALHSRLPDLWLLYIGDGPDREALERRVRDLELSNAVFFSGSVAHPEVPAWLAAADIFALPSHKEGVPVSLLEAMAAGLPAVATDVGGIGEVLEDGRTGYVVPLKDPQALHDELERLVSDGASRDRMGAAARETVSKKFLWDHNASAMLELYEEVLERRVSPCPEAVDVRRQ